MKLRTLVFALVLGGLAHLAPAAQDQPKDSIPAAKKKPAADDDDVPKPKKHAPRKRDGEDKDDSPKARKDADQPAKTKDEDSKSKKPGEKADDKAEDKKDGKKPEAKAGSDIPQPHDPPHPAAVSTLNPDELANYDQYPADLQKLIEQALAMTRLNLPYLFGGSTPADGGMDCSGTISYLLTEHGVKGVPRSSDAICDWVRQRSGMHLAPDDVALSDDAFSALRPGDLLFWTGTYDTLPRRLPVSHIMMYLGTLKKSGKPVVFGSSEGRYYGGERRNGVSVFDFSMPRNGSKAAFFGYGTIPGLSRAKVKEEIRKALAPPDSATHQIAMATRPLKSSDEEVEAPAPSVKKNQPAVEDKPVETHPASKDTPPSPVAKTKKQPAPAEPGKSEEDKSVQKGEGSGLHSKSLAAKGSKPVTGNDAKDTDVASAPKKTAHADNDDDDDTPKKPRPHKPVVRHKAPVHRKSSSDDDPGAAVRRAMNSIRRAFD